MLTTDPKTETEATFRGSGTPRIRFRLDSSSPSSLFVAFHFFSASGFSCRTCFSWRDPALTPPLLRRHLFHLLPPGVRASARKNRNARSHHCLYHMTKNFRTENDEPPGRYKYGYACKNEPRMVYFHFPTWRGIKIISQRQESSFELCENPRKFVSLEFSMKTAPSQKVLLFAGSCLVRRCCYVQTAFNLSKKRRRIRPSPILFFLFVGYLAHLSGTVKGGLFQIMVSGIRPTCTALTST